MEEGQSWFDFKFTESLDMVKNNGSFTTSEGKNTRTTKILNFYPFSYYQFKQGRFFKIIGKSKLFRISKKICWFKNVKDFWRKRI